MTDVAGNAVFQASRQRILPGAWVGIPGAKKLNSGDLRKEVMKANEKQRPTVRKAGPNDCKAIAELCEQRHREEDFYIAPFDQPKVEKLVGHLIDAPNGVVVVAEVGGRLVGCVVGAVVDRWFSAERTSIPFAFYVTPTHRSGSVLARMFWEFQAKSLERGARMVEAAVVSSQLSSSAIAALEQSGFSPVAQHFVWVPAGADVTEALHGAH